MNVFILTDMEGISGVNSIDCMDRQNQPYQESRKRLTEELIFAAEVCRKNGAEQIYFLDGHGGGGNILPELIPQWLQQSTLAQWQQLLQDGAVDCQIEIGSHARAGTVGGFLDHTISSGNVYRHCINGREYGELGLHAILCGRYNIPIVFCSGDEAACTQAKDYIPDIYTSAVTVAEVRNTAISSPDAKERRDVIYTTYKNALDSGDENVYFIDGSAFFSDRNDIMEYTLDTCHPTDEGFERMANLIGTVLANTLDFEKMK